MEVLDMEFVLHEIGDFGKYQASIYFLICIPIIFISANTMTYIFSAGIPTYRCYVPGCDNFDLSHFGQETWLQHAIPSQSGTNASDYIPSQCYYFVRNTTGFFNSCVIEDFDHSHKQKCDQWVFDPQESTILNEWNITCQENQWKLSLVGTMHFAGVLAGGILFGYLADRFGRKKIMTTSLMFVSVTGILKAISPSYKFYLLFVFIHAFVIAGVFPSAFVLGLELVGQRKRNLSSIVINYFFAFGEAALGLVAWYTGDWKMIQFLVSAPATIFIVYYWLIPESLRWLYAKKKYEEVQNIIYKAAKMNGVKISNNLTSLLEKMTLTEDSSTTVPTNSMLESAKQFCMSKRLMIRTMVLFYIWPTNAFVYYGLSMSATSLAGNKYLNFILVSLVEIPGYTMAWYLHQKGRRFAQTTALVLCGLTCSAAAFLPSEYKWFVLLLFLFGKIGITSSFASIYVHTAEMYPTAIRTSLVTVCATVGRTGAMVAPFVPLLAHQQNAVAQLHLLVYGGVALLAGFLAAYLPETRDVALPNTVKEAEELN